MKKQNLEEDIILGKLLRLPYHKNKSLTPYQK